MPERAPLRQSHERLEVLVTGRERATARVPIVFVHGTGHAAWCWRHFAAYFGAAGYATYALSLRGHGGSAGTLRNASVADYVSDVRRVCESLPSAPVLFGHSLGGLVVQKYLQRFPAAAAVLIAPVPVIGMLGANWQIGFRQPRALLRSLLKRDFAQFYHSPPLVHELLFLPTTPRALVEEDAKRIGPESFKAALEMLLPLRGRRSFGCPVLVIGGDRDKIVPLRHVRRTAAALGATLAVIENAAHNSILDVGWEGVAARISGWLKGHGLNAAAASRVIAAPTR